MSTKLVVLHNNEPMTTSLIVASGTKNQHKNVMGLIRIYKPDLEEFGEVAFETRLNKQGSPTEYAILNEPQTTLIITYMKNTKVVREFKKNLVKEFFRMRKLLLESSSRKDTPEWIKARQAGKVARRLETDVLKQFIEYARQQGSTNADRYYANISKMENAALFLIEEKFPNLREVLTAQQLNWIQTADTVVIKALQDGMSQGLPYKGIYQLAKRRVETFAGIIPKSSVPLDDSLLLEPGTCEQLRA